MLYKRHSKITWTVGKQISSGQVVRIQSSRHTFYRALHLQNTYELFKGNNIEKDHIPITYNLIELDGEPIKGIFYREELTPVEDKGLYAIEILKKRKRKGKREYLIRYVHFPASPEKWVSENMLEKLN